MSTDDGRPVLTARRLGIDSQHEAIAFVQQDCAACKSEGFSAHSRVLLKNGAAEIFATLHYVTSNLVGAEEIGLSEIAWKRLHLEGAETLTISHPAPLTSFADVRGKIFGQKLTENTARQIIDDIVHGRYSDIQLTAFVTACSARILDDDETIALTRAMVDSGSRLDWDASIIADKHCVGGLPGNRTTPIVVAIAAANGLTMPKTSSKAITSPAGTADTMSTITNVSLSLSDMKAVLTREQACFVWGGSVNFSPADDTLIRIQKALDLDSEGPLIASVLSKKIAAGATHLVIDIPVGPTAKVRSAEAAESLRQHFEAISAHFDIKISVRDNRWRSTGWPRHWASPWKRKGCSRSVAERSSRAAGITRPRLRVGWGFIGTHWRGKTCARHAAGTRNPCFRSGERPFRSHLHSPGTARVAARGRTPARHHSAAPWPSGAN